MKQHIKRFKEINDFFEHTGFPKRTNLKDFFVFQFEELPKNCALQMGPHQKDFYQICLIRHAHNAQANINEQSSKTLENTLYFLSPEHIFSWQRNSETTGFLVYFKKSFINFFAGDFKQVFSFFSLSQQNFFSLEQAQASDLAQEFDKLYQEYYSLDTYRVEILQALLLSLLFKSKQIEEQFSKAKQQLSKKQILVYNFQNLVANCYIKYKKVGNYAKELNLSANSLNQAVKEVLNKTAKEIISEKIIQEIKKQLKYSNQNIAEIAYALGFEEPTHFVRFFKKQTQLTPQTYRNSQM